MTATIARRRIEVLADEPLIPAIERLAAEAGIAYYTLLPTLGGMGHSGRWRDDQVSGATAKVMLMTVTSEGPAERFIELLTPLLARHRLLLLASTVEVVRGERFE